MDQDCGEHCWVNHPEMTEPVRGLRCGLKTKSGEIRIILKNVELLRSASGSVIGAIESFEDITERERLERDLWLSENRYRSLYANMQNAFGLYELIVDEKGQPVDFRLLELNPAFERLLEDWSLNPVGKRISQLFPASGANLIRRYGPVAAGGGPLRLEEYLPEIRRTFNVLAYSPESNQLALLLDDVTALKTAESGRLGAVQMIDTIREISLSVIARLEPKVVAERLLGLLNRIQAFDSAFILLVEPHSLKVRHQIWQGEDLLKTV
jgi:PAS domain-containing protein